MDLRALVIRTLVIPFAGAALALTAGLWLGGVMRPELAFGALGGPQILSGRGGERAPSPMDGGAAFVAYNGRVPDYVLGTDVTRPIEMVAAADPAPEPVMDRAEPAAPPAEVVQVVAHQEPPAAAPTFPSTDGGADYGRDAPVPPAPSTDAPAVAG